MPGVLVESDSATENPVRAINPVFKSGTLSVNRATRAVVVSGCPLYLTDKEFSVLAILMQRKGVTITKQMIMDHLYHGANQPALRIVDVFVCKLRKKLSALSGGETFIDTIRGRGYVMRDIVAMSENEVRAVTHRAAA